MTLAKIWVLAEANDGKVTSSTLEILTKARELAGTVEAIYTGGDAEAIAATLGAHGATTVHTTGDLGGALLGVPVSAAIAAAIESAGAPDAILFATSYAGRDIAGRLSVKLDKTVLTNGVELVLNGDSLAVVEPVFGGTTNVTTTFVGDGPHLALLRPKSFVAEENGGAPAAVNTIAVPDTGAAGAGESQPVAAGFSESHTERDPGARRPQRGTHCFQAGDPGDRRAATAVVRERRG